MLLASGFTQAARLTRWRGPDTGREPLLWILHVGYAFVPLGMLSLDLLVESPRYETKQFGDMPLLDVSAAYDVEAGKNTIFIVNRSQNDRVPLEIHWQDIAPKRISSAHQLAGPDPKAANTWDSPNQLTMQAIYAPQIIDGKAEMSLPPLSFTALGVEV